MRYDSRMPRTRASDRAEPPPPSDPQPAQDGEYRALIALSRLVRGSAPSTPLEQLEEVADVARTLTNARYAALGITDEQDHMEGFVTSGIDDRKGLKTPPAGHGLLGTLRQDGKPVRIDNGGDHPEGFGFPPQHPDMVTLLGVPLWAAGVVRGSLYVTDRDGGKPFRDDDEAVLVTLARHVTHIIENDWH